MLETYYIILCDICGRPFFKKTGYAESREEAISFRAGEFLLDKQEALRCIDKFISLREWKKLFELEKWKTWTKTKKGKIVRCPACSWEKTKFPPARKRKSHPTLEIELSNGEKHSITLAD